MDENDLIVKSLETEPVKNLLGPITKELGLIGDDFGSIIRFYVNRNLRNIFRKWAAQRDNKPLPPETNIGKLIPAIQLASLQDNDELQERWAALLENTVTVPDDVLPSFGQTLSQLTATEAHYLSRLYAHVGSRQRKFNAGWEIGSENDLHALYDERLRSMTYVQAEMLKKESNQAQLAIDDLERLGIIAQRQEIGKLRISERDLRSIATLSSKIQDTELDSIYFFSEYGVAFIKCVTPPSEMHTNGGS